MRSLQEYLGCKQVKKVQENDKELECWFFFL